jgi:hypothetical protein
MYNNKDSYDYVCYTTKHKITHVHHKENEEKKKQMIKYEKNEEEKKNYF